MQELLPSLITGGVVASVLGTALALVRIALGAERRRADDWRDAAKTATAANALMSSNVDKLVDSVEKLATTQREMMVLLQQNIAARRSRGGAS